MKPKAAVLGLGACFRKMLPGIRKHFKIDLCYDPLAFNGPQKPNAWQLMAYVEKKACVQSEDSFFAYLKNLRHDIDAIFILTPPPCHARQLLKAANCCNTIFIEKPAVASQSEVNIINEAVQINPKIFFSDFYIDIRSAPLFLATKQRIKETQWLVPYITNEAKASLDSLMSMIGEVEMIEAKLLEGFGEAKSTDNRPWLREQKGGGVLLDLAYHYFTLIYCLGYSHARIVKSVLGIHSDDQEGYDFIPCTKESKTAETYAFVKLVADSIEITIEVAKHWTHDERVFIIHGKNGTLEMNYGELEGQRNVLVANISNESYTFPLSAVYWDMVTEGFLNYFNHSTHQASPIPRNLNETLFAHRLVEDSRNVAFM